MNRADRRLRTDLVIKRREVLACRFISYTDPSKYRGHFFAKRDSLGHCSNRSCSLCAIMRTIKREESRNVRYGARKVIAEQMRDAA